MRPAELIERGIRAYTRGQLGEAERFWREALEVEPANVRARSFLDLLDKRHAQSAASSSAGPVPLPAPPVSSAPEEPPGQAPASTPVPLPNPGWGGPPPVSWRGETLVQAPPPEPPPEAENWRGTLAEFGVELTPPVAPLTAAPEVDLTTALEVAGREARGEADREEAAPGRREPTTLSDYAPSPWDQGPARSPVVVLEDGAGLDLSSVEEQSGVRSLVPEGAETTSSFPGRKLPSEVEVWMQGARELFALGDFSGSLEMIEKILKLDPSHQEARAYLRQNEATLVAMYESKLGSRGAIPRLAIRAEEVMWLNLDHRAGFLLAQIDGMVSYEDLFALSGLPRLDTARILSALLQEGVIAS